MEFTKEEKVIINKYEGLALLNPGVENECDEVVYTFVKIMFEHPLADGNKRLATKYLLYHLDVDNETIDKVCKSLAKENA